MSLIQIPIEFMCRDDIKLALANNFDVVEYLPNSPDGTMANIRVSKASRNLILEQDDLVTLTIQNVYSESVPTHITEMNYEIIAINGVTTDGLNHGRRRARGSTIHNRGLFGRSKSKG